MRSLPGQWSTNLAEPDSVEGISAFLESASRHGGCEMPSVYGLSDETVREILSSVRTIMVVGASPNPARPSNDALGFFKRFGRRTRGLARLRRDVDPTI